MFFFVLDSPTTHITMFCLSWTQTSHKLHGVWGSLLSVILHRYHLQTEQHILSRRLIEPDAGVISVEGQDVGVRMLRDGIATWELSGILAYLSNLGHGISDFLGALGGRAIREARS